MLKKLICSLHCLLLTSSLAFAADTAEHELETTADAMPAAVMHGADLEHGAELGHEAASGGLPQFDPTWFPSQLFWLAVTFIVLYVFFSKKTLPEISSVIENRKNHIQADLVSAETLTAEAEAVQALYEQGQADAREKSSATIASVEQDMKKSSADAYDAFRKRSENEIKAAEDRIAKAKSLAMDDMNTIAAEVASEAVQKITGVSTDVQQAKSIIQDLLGKAKAA